MPDNQIGRNLIMFEALKLFGPLAVGVAFVLFLIVGAALGWIQPGRLNSPPATQQQQHQQNIPITCGWNAFDPSHPCASTSMGR